MTGLVIVFITDYVIDVEIRLSFKFSNLKFHLQIFRLGYLCVSMQCLILAKLTINAMRILATLLCKRE